MRRRLGSSLCVRGPGRGKTEGIIEVDGERYHVSSGQGKPSSELPNGLPGRNGNVKWHVEGQVAALMHGPDGALNVYKGLADG